MSLVKTETLGHIYRITLADPTRLNAQSSAMIAELRAAIENAGDARVIVLAAEGKAFCAGHDLKEMTKARDAANGGREYFEELFHEFGALSQLISRIPQPVIAQVAGVATAAGCQLVASCDLAVAAENARFGVNGISIGLFCSTPIVPLSRAIGPKKALELALTGEFMSADEALQFGLVNKICPPDALEDETMAMAELIAKKLPSAVRIGKFAFHRQMDMDTQSAYDFMCRVMTENIMQADTAEGIRAFGEKREPKWSS